jgi:hypothetical protein
MSARQAAGGSNAVHVRIHSLADRFCNYRTVQRRRVAAVRRSGRSVAGRLTIDAAL